MKFLMMIKHKELAEPFQPPQSLMDAMGEFVTEGFAKGWLKETAGLKPTKEGVRIIQKGGTLRTVDGPFAEAKEIVGGYAIVETATRAEALEVTSANSNWRRASRPTCSPRNCRSWPATTWRPATGRRAAVAATTTMPSRPETTGCCCASPTSPAKGSRRPC